MPLASVRGATTCPVNEPEAVTRATEELVTALCKANPAITPSSALAFIFTVTPDLDAAFPAAAARGLGYHETSLLGAVEAAVPGAPSRCIRVLAFYETTETGKAGRATHGTPVYLHEAAALRPDLGGPPRAGGPCRGSEAPVSEMGAGEGGCR